MRFVLKNVSGLPVEFDIEFVKLKDGEYDFHNEIGKQFFEHFENPDVKDANIAVTTHLNKQVHLMHADLEMKGWVSLTCDRCLEPLMMSVEASYKVIFHLLGEKNTGTGLEDDMVEFVEVNPNATSVNTAQQVYESVLLAVPMIRNCDGLDEKPCNQEMLEKLNNINQSGDGNPDPRWDKLKDLLK